MPIVRISVTDNTIHQLGLAIACYYADHGTCPPDGNAALMRALASSGSKGYAYWESNPESLNKAGEILDAWNHPLVYRRIPTSKAVTKEKPFELYSTGPNGIDERGGGDDVGLRSK